MQEEKEDKERNFPGGPVVGTSPSNVGEVWIQFLFGDLRFPHTSRPKNQNINNSRYWLTLVCSKPLVYVIV